MRVLIAINALGVLAATLYAAGTFTPSYAPTWAGIAIIVYLAGAIQPMFRQQLAIDTGFREMEDSFMDARRRERGLGPKAEIITDDQPTPSFRKPPARNFFAVAAFAAATGMFAYDALRLLTR